MLITSMLALLLTQSSPAPIASTSALSMTPSAAHVSVLATSSPLGYYSVGLPAAEKPVSGPKPTHGGHITRVAGVTHPAASIKAKDLAIDLHPMTDEEKHLFPGRERFDKTEWYESLFKSMMIVPIPEHVDEWHNGGKDAA